MDLWLDQGGGGGEKLLSLNLFLLFWKTEDRYG